MAEVGLITAVDEDDVKEEGGVIGAGDDRDGEVSDLCWADGAIDQARDGSRRCWARDALWVFENDRFALFLASLSVSDPLGRDDKLCGDCLE